MNRVIVFVLAMLTMAVQPVLAQESWTLNKCIEYAVQNNIQVKQSAISSEIAKATYKQSKGNLLPSLNGFASHGYNWGQTIDPFTNQFASQRVRQNSFSLRSDVTLFAGFSNMNAMKQSKYDYEASKFDVEKMRNDISMNVATSFLQIMFNEELLAVAEQQVAITGQQVERTNKLVEAGQLPKGDALNLASQLATEEQNMVNAQNNLTLSYLSLIQLLQLQGADANSFKIQRPDLPEVNESMVNGTPADVYNTALLQMPEIKASEQRVMSAEKSMASAKGGRSPQLTLSGSYGTGYSGASSEPFGEPTFSVDTFGVTAFSLEPVLIPSVSYNTRIKSFADQFDDNLNKSLTFSLTIPIFNGWSVETNINRSRLNHENAKLTLESTKNQLLSDIQRAYTDALGAYKSYNASKKSVEALRESFKYAEIRYQEKMINAVDYNDAKNKLTNAESDLLRSKYDYIFKTKVLDFYQGKPLTF